MQSVSTKENTPVVTQIPEELGRSPSLVSDDETFLPASLDLKDFHHRTITRLDVPEDILIDFKGIVGRLLEENWVGNGPDIGLSARCLGWLGMRKEETG